MLAPVRPHMERRLPGQRRLFTWCFPAHWAPERSPRGNGTLKHIAFRLQPAGQQRP